jgi:dTDP-4-dehydrorhamnose 3,5-epimerase-like enzyme
VPGGETRGGHAYKTTEEFIIALSGSFDVVIDTEKEKKVYSLNRSYFGLFVPAGTWRHMENFSTNSLALVLSSTFYDENDYIREYSSFLNFRFTTKNIQKLISLNEKVDNPSKDLKSHTVFDCSVIDLDINHRDKGNITVFENKKTLPLNIERVYYLYDIPGGENRGGHSHINQKQLLVAASGSFDVIIDDGNTKHKIPLNRPNNCLLIVPGIWREIVNFSSGSICLVLTSELYDEEDYIRNYRDFINMKVLNGKRTEK